MEKKHMLDDCNLMTNPNEFKKRSNDILSFLDANINQDGFVILNDNLKDRIVEEYGYSYDQINICCSYLVKQDKIKKHSVTTFYF